MHYYKHNIGDFNSATRHLTRIERSIYRDLIEFYYDLEGQLPLNIEVVARKIIAVDDSTTVERMLREFFNETPTGWFHSRCDAEILAFKKANTQKSLAGISSANKREARKQAALAGNSTTVENPLNEKPTKHKTVNIKHKTVNTVEADASFDEIWKAYPKRPGSSRADSLKAYRARIKQGVKPQEIMAGVNRYAAFVKAQGTEPQFIKQPSTFLGVGLHFLADWTIPPPTTNPAGLKLVPVVDEIEKTKQLLKSYEYVKKPKPDSMPLLSSFIKPKGEAN